jgi:hypothetical protein
MLGNHKQRVRDDEEMLAPVPYFPCEAIEPDPPL